ncbi:hypothetical protein [Calidifontibacillus erzurumensis]|uniref:hypothetical protein n=1 Tax=Calidifontibacillus erzurumensis TaxID=2741433 RepID=UPI0035B551E6
MIINFDMRDAIIEFWRQFNTAKTDEDFLMILDWIEQTYIEFFIESDVVFACDNQENNIQIISITDYFPFIEMTAQIWRKNPKVVYEKAKHDIFTEHLIEELKNKTDDEIEKMKFMISPIHSPFIEKSKNLFFKHY